MAATGAGRLAEARAGFEALQRDPALRADALHMLGVIAGIQGDHSSAASWIRKAIEINRNRPDFYHNLASALASAGRRDEAREARNDFGIALHVNRQYREALAVFEQILAETPNHLATLIDIAASLQELGDYRRGMGYAARVLFKARSEVPRLAALLEQVRDLLPEVYEAASQSFATPLADITGEKRALLLPKALNNFANCALRAGYVAFAEEAFALSHELAPDEALVRWNLAQVRLLRGDFEHGFAHYESRWQWQGFDFPNRQLPKPVWNGGAIAGKRLLVYAEQGFGDTIQFARFLPELTRRGAHVWFEVQQELFWLMKTAFRNDRGTEVIPRMPDPRSVYCDPPYDLHCAVMSLAKHFELKLSDLPWDTEYINAEPHAVLRWSEKLGPRNRPRVGLAWAGRPEHKRDRERSLSLMMFYEVLKIPAIEWVSLQLGAPREQIATCGAVIRDFGDELHDFAETAALIANLDLVITTDTAVGHLAGAMGKPVWILLPFVPDWRWLLDREDSPWYATVRLLRQVNFGDWDSVVGRIIDELGATFGVTIPRVQGTGSPTTDVASVAPIAACKVCAQESRLFGVVDFEKNCEERNGLNRPLSGISVHYYRCSGCGLVFTKAFDHWDRNRFSREIYNNEYAIVDPDYAESRPKADAAFLSRFFQAQRQFRFLDFAGGNGTLAELMRREGFDCLTWDPLDTEAYAPVKKGTFDVVTAFEVFEHTPSPLDTFRDAVSFLKADGILVFSTLAIDDYPPEGIKHWYVAPRNGHVTIYSKAALALIAARLGLTLHHLNQGLHLAWANRPAWLELA